MPSEQEITDLTGGIQSGLIEVETSILQFYKPECLYLMVISEDQKVLPAC